MLLHAGATISVCNKDTVNPKSISIMGDIVFTCCNQAQMIKKDWLKKDAIVIDIGINQIEDSSKKSGHRLVGDVDFDNVKEHISAITPVPGGIGPLTVAMLMKNIIMNTQRNYWN